MRVVMIYLQTSFVVSMATVLSVTRLYAYKSGYVFVANRSFFIIIYCKFKHRFSEQGEWIDECLSSNLGRVRQVIHWCDEHDSGIL